MHTDTDTESSGNLTARRYHALFAVAESIAACHDLSTLLLDLIKKMKAVTSFDAVSVLLYDEKRHVLRVRIIEAPTIPPQELPVELSVEKTGAGQVWKTQQPMMITDLLEAAQRYPGGLATVHASGIRTIYMAPLTSAGRRLGLMIFASVRQDAWNDEDQKVLHEVTNLVAIAVDNVLNLERARNAELQATRHSDRLQLLLEINNAVVSNLNLADLLKATSECIRRAITHDFAALTLYDEENGLLQPHALDVAEELIHIQSGVVLPLEGTAPGRAVTTRNTVLVRDLNLVEFPDDAMRKAGLEGFRSGCSVPLISHDRVLGTLDVASKRENAFDDDDAELLTQIGKQLSIAVENAIGYGEIESLKNRLNQEKLYLEEEIQTTCNFEQIVGSSATLKRILKQVETVAPTDSAVLIRGETGTGKELIARAIHNLSTRGQRTLVKINCAAIPTGLLESELFGHEKGAFTGAISQRIGRFELANRGTLFLDEVGDIPLELQPKLLRVLQEQEFERLGSTRTQKADVRLIAATNCDLQQMVGEKKYRSDLYYRLNVFPITIPPLRERREDVPELTRFFTQMYSRRLKKQITSIATEAMNSLTSYDWPGNVRELEHFIERAVILTQGSELEVSLQDLKVSSKPVGALLTLESAERDHILRALEQSNWVVGGTTGAAARLGMKRTTLQSRMQKLGIERGRA